MKSNSPPGHGISKKLTDSKIWRESIGAIQQMWANYLQVLSTSFNRMSRFEQEELITKYSSILSLGGAGLIWCQIYYFFHPLLRLVAIPVTLFLAYWFGKNIVSRIMIDRLSKHLK